MPQLILTLVSGEKLHVTHIRLVNGDVVGEIRSKMHELAAITRQQSASVIDYRNSTFIDGVMAAASVVLWLTQKAQEDEVRRLTDDLAELIERARGGGAFVPVSQIQSIEIPIPGCWQMEMSKRLRTAEGTIDKNVTLCHSGDTFVAVQLDDKRELNILWDKVESAEYRKEECSEQSKNLT